VQSADNYARLAKEHRRAAKARARCGAGARRGSGRRPMGSPPRAHAAAANRSFRRLGASAAGARRRLAFTTLLTRPRPSDPDPSPRNTHKRPPPNPPGLRTARRLRRWCWTRPSRVRGGGLRGRGGAARARLGVERGGRRRRWGRPVGAGRGAAASRPRFWRRRRRCPAQRARALHKHAHIHPNQASGRGARRQTSTCTRASTGTPRRRPYCPCAEGPPRAPRPLGPTAPRPQLVARVPRAARGRRRACSAAAPSPTRARGGPRLARLAPGRRCAHHAAAAAGLTPTHPWLVPSRAFRSLQTSGRGAGPLPRRRALRGPRGGRARPSCDRAGPLPATRRRCRPARRLKTHIAHAAPPPARRPARPAGRRLWRLSPSTALPCFPPQRLAYKPM
jgi:hypothetical protein